MGSTNCSDIRINSIEFQGQLEVHLKKLGLPVKLDGDANVENMDKENSKFEPLKINFSGDVPVDIVPLKKILSFKRSI